MSTVIINSLRFELPDVYAPGHVCDAGEARALNQVRRENIRNNFAPRVKAARTAGLDETIVREMFDEYAANYSFTANFRERNPADRIEAQCRKLALEVARAAARTKGQNFDDFDPDQQEIAISMLIRERPALREEAAARIRRLDELSASIVSDEADDLFDDLDDDDGKA